MKVLHVLSSNKFSGAENVVCQIIDLFRNDANMQMAYCSVNGPVKDALLERHITFLPMDSLNRKNLSKIIKLYNPDIIHAHDMKASYLAAISCGSIPLISHIHNNSFKSRKLTKKSIAYLVAAFKAKTIFWVSESAYNGYLFKRCINSKGIVLYNVLDINELYQKMEKDINNYPYDVVYLGRLDIPKNPYRLIDVFREVIKLDPDIRIAIIGEGNMLDEIKALVLKLQLDNNISFLGFLNNPLKVLHDSKVMVLTSLWEGTPMCVLEALALGVPVVSTPVDGLITIIDEKCGVLSDSNFELAESIVKLVKDNVTHERLSYGAKTKALQICNLEEYRYTLKNVYQNAICSR